MKTTRDLVFISLLASMAIIIHVVERGIPNPVPWLRMGWANMVVLAALELFGTLPAFGVVCLRIFIGGLLSGTLFGPSFLMSFSGGFASFAVIAFLHKYFSSFIGLVGISLFGAYTHVTVQIIVAYYVLIQHKSVFFLLPVLFSISLVTGFVNGLGSCYLVKHLRKVLYGYLP